MVGNWKLATNGINLFVCLEVYVRCDSQGVASIDLCWPYRREQGPAAVGWFPLWGPVLPTAALARRPKVLFIFFLQDILFCCCC